MIETALHARCPGLRIRFVDTQPFNLRTGGTTFYPGRGEITLARREDCGLRRPTGSWSINMLLSGGMAMYRRMTRYAGRLLGDAEALILCHDRIYIETAMVRAAHARGIPTVMVQEGPFCTIGHGAARSRSLRLKKALSPVVTRLGILPPIPEYGGAGHDRVIAASDCYRRQWIAAGLAPDAVVVGGVPRYDPLALVDQAHAQRHGGPLRILYLVQPFAAHGKVNADAAHAMQTILAEGLNRAAAAMPLSLVIRSHPRSGGDDVAPLRKALDFAPMDDGGARPLETALTDIDVVVGHYSSGLLESLLAGRPILCLPVPEDAFAERNEGAKQQWFRTISVPVAETADEVAHALTSMRASSNLVAVNWPRIHDEVGLIDGQSAARCADTILALLDARAPAAA